IAIPIIIHLFNLRKYKTVRFSSIRFLKEIKQAKRSRSHLKNLLILLSRILAITFLVLAFAKPYIPTKQKQTEIVKNIFFYIDNSFSMESVLENGMLLDVAKNKAEEIANQYDTESNFFLITNDFSAKHSRSFTKAEIGSRFQQLTTTAHYKSLAEIISRQQSLNKQNENAQMYVLTDLQKSTFRIDNISQNDSSLNVLIIPLSKTAENNLYIDSCWMSSPIIQEGKSIEIIARVVNKSDVAISNLPAFLHVNKLQKAISNFSISPGQKQNISFKFTPASSGFKQCKISLQDYPISFDDNFYFSFEILDKIKALHIYEQNQSFALQSLFEKDDAIDYKSVSIGQINYEEIKNQQLLILDGLTNISSGLLQSIKDFAKDGGSLAVIPSNDINFDSYKMFSSALNLDEYIAKDTTKQKANKISYSHKVFEGVFEKEEKKINLPIVLSHYKISNKNNTNKQSILSLEMGDDFISHYTYSAGDIYLFASPLNNTSSNLGKHALFVPLLYNMALMSFKTTQLYYSIGENQYFDAPSSENKENIYHLQSDNYDIIPTERFVSGKRKLYVQEQIKEAGNYLLTAGGKTIAALSFNYGNKESDPNIYSSKDVAEILQKNNINNIKINSSTNQNISNIVQEIQLGKSYWKHCIILALLFLLLEIMLIKFLKS
nr:BatA domain-containing protein [Flavobacteriales bacterium]